MYSQVGAVVSERQWNERTRRADGAERNAIEHRVAARRLYTRFDDRAVAKDAEIDDHAGSGIDLRTFPVVADLLHHPLQIERVRKIAAFESGDSGCARLHLRCRRGRG